MQLQASIQRLCVWCAYAVRRPTQSCAAVSVCCSLPCAAASTRCSLPCAAAVLHKARDIAVAGLATLTKRWSQSHQRSRRRPRSTTTRQVLYMYFDYYTKQSKLQLSHTTSLRKCTHKKKQAHCCQFPRRDRSCLCSDCKPHGPMPVASTGIGCSHSTTFLFFIIVRR